MTTMNIENLDLILTYRCNSICRHCLISPQLRKGETMPEEYCKTLISNAAKTFKLNSLLFFGGEPLLAMDSLISALKAAKEVKIPQTYLITNGNPLHEMPLQNSSIFESDQNLNPSIDYLFYFRQRIHGKERNALQNIAKNLSEHTLYSAEFSLDVFHHEYLDPEETIELASHLKDFKAVRVSFSPRYLTERRENWWDKATEKMMDYIKEMGFMIAVPERIKPRGNALRNLSQFFHCLNVQESMKCPNESLFSDTNSLSNVCISPVGEIIVCDNIIVGKEPADNIINTIKEFSFNNDSFLRILRERNLKGLFDLAKSNGISINPLDTFHVCDLCTKLRSVLSINNICDVI